MPTASITTTPSAIAAELTRVRQRTLGLVDPLTDEQQRAQHSPIMSPLVWDLAHVGNYEDLWLCRALGGPPPVHPEYDDLYDAFEHPRAERPSLPILGPAAARAYIADVRARVLDLLDTVDLAGGDDPLLRDGFVYGMVIQHEHQHDETMLATRQLMGEGAPELVGTVAAPAAPATEPPGIDVEVEAPGGRFVMGTDDEPWAYDNERGAHEHDLAPFAIDAAPVTNDRYATFVAAGGYDDPRWWTPEGWSWRVESGTTHPQFWREAGDDWQVLRFGSWRPLRRREPVQHVCWYEADAFARWAGRRLPTETEWEYAASWDPDAGTKRRHPWGNHPPSSASANLGQRHDGPAEVGTLPAGASPIGCHHLVGDVWEWTSSEFRPYPGFVPFPYREYSEVFWGSTYKVLRGGSWATDPTAVRATFRNWDLPIRRQIFAGFRTARDLRS